MQQKSTELREEFRLGEYLVQPKLHLIRGPDGEVHVEPQVMCLLVLPAGSPGEVVTRDKLIVNVCDSHLAQTKRSREYVLQVPAREDMVVVCRDVMGVSRSVSKLVGDFERSDTARIRYEKAAKLREQHKAKLGAASDEYLFLGRNGMPFYLHSFDRLNAVRKITMC